MLKSARPAVGESDQAPEVFICDEESSHDFVTNKSATMLKKTIQKPAFDVEEDVMISRQPHEREI